MKELMKIPLFFPYIFISIINIFILWFTCCCVKEEEKECCNGNEEGCCNCNCPCCSDNLWCACYTEDSGNAGFNFAICIIFFAIFAVKFYVWLLVKCCGKRSRYCIQICLTSMDIIYVIEFFITFKNFTAFYIILIILFIISAISSIAFMIYINVKYKKNDEEDYNNTLNEDVQDAL